MTRFLRPTTKAWNQYEEMREKQEVTNAKVKLAKQRFNAAERKMYAFLQLRKQDVQQAGVSDQEEARLAKELLDSYNDYVATLRELDEAC
jgi:hypothetical protein